MRLLPANICQFTDKQYKLHLLQPKWIRINGKSPLLYENAREAKAKTGSKVMLGIGKTSTSTQVWNRNLNLK